MDFEMNTNEQLLSFFFKNDKLVRLSTDAKELAKEGPRELKKKAQAELKDVMYDYLQVKPDSTLMELAYALKNSYFRPPQCPVCSKLVKFTRDNWAKHCSISCSLKNEQAKSLKQEESLKKWGVKHQFLREDSLLKKEELYKTQNITREKKAIVKERVRLKEQVKAEKVKEKEVWLENRRIEKSSPFVNMGFVNLVHGKKDRIVFATCNTCKSVFSYPRSPQCFICHAPAKESKQWNFMRNFPEHKRDLRIPYNNSFFKLDATWIDKNLAFEFNGLYWHSSAPQPGNRQPVDKFYHQNKMLAAKQANIRLIMIWEDRANDEKYVNHLKALFVKPNKVCARKCEVRIITSLESKLFLNEHHRDGAINGASIHYGLFYENKLVSVATFGKNRFKGEGFELFRLATKIGIIVVGGISKLISYFRKLNPLEKLTTYSDAEWGWGQGYLNAGGKLIGLTKPGYFYYDAKTQSRAHRLKLSKGNFSKFTGLEWDENLNESENALRSKCYQIWNCGNWKFEWDALHSAKN